MYEDPPILEMKGIVKRFGGLTAVDHVDLQLWSGECLALVGENGAGKSTLIKTLTGIYQPDEGHISVNGCEVKMASRRDAKDLGIEAVYQDLALVDTLDVASNVFLGGELTIPVLGRFLQILDNRKMSREAELVLKERLAIDLQNRRDPVFNFSGGERQSVAIARAIYWKAKVLVLDEPTASLGVEEIKRTIEVTRRAKEEGAGVIWISHNLEQVFAVADRMQVLRGGRCAGVCRRDETTMNKIVDLIVGGSAVAS